MHVWEKQRESVCKTEGEDGGGRERGEKKTTTKNIWTIRFMPVN